MVVRQKGGEVNKSRGKGMLRIIFLKVMENH